MIIQGSPEWLAARAGSLGASCMQDAIARVKGGWAASRASLMGRLIAERLTGRPYDTFKSQAMRYGSQCEPEARSTYAFMFDVDVEQVGLIRHPTIIGSHASPDGLIGADGLLELKCPETHTHLNTLLTGKISEQYMTQMMWQMACTGRQWVDYVSYDNRLPDEMQIWVRRIHRDQKRIIELENHAIQFLKELDETLSKLCATVGVVPPVWHSEADIDMELVA